MKRRFLPALVVAGLLAVTPLWAETTPRINTFELGSEIYHASYEEPDFDVNNDGTMYGVIGSITHRNPNHLMLKADGRAAWGTMDYSSSASGSLDGIDDYALEGRVVGGYDFKINDTWTFTPFFGVGYRYLNDDSTGERSSNGALGYERESNYFYSPLGGEFSVDLRNGWSLTFGGEYDILWSGKQESHLETVNSNFGTVSNDQDSGDGARGFVRLQKNMGHFDLAIEPFFRWWRVDDSQTSNVTFAGAIVGYAYEPKNETYEVGGKLALLF